MPAQKPGCPSLLSLLLPIVLLAHGTLGHGPRYCIIGAGPAGLQAALYFQHHGLDYVVYEQNAQAGSFFLQFPRGGELISMDRRQPFWTESLRYDWHTLLYANESFPTWRARSGYDYAHYPQAKTYQKYLQHVADTHRLVIEYGTKIDVPRRETDRPGCLMWIDARGKGYLGTWNRHMVSTADPDLQGRVWDYADPNWDGDHVPCPRGDGYIPTDIAVVGKGNSAWEIARILGDTCRSAVHVLYAGPPRLAHRTHYPGDLRLRNLDVIDRYALKVRDTLHDLPRFLLDPVMLCLVPKNGKIHLEPRFDFSTTTAADVNHLSVEHVHDDPYTRHGEDLWKNALGRRDLFHRDNKTDVHLADPQPESEIDSEGLLPFGVDLVVFATGFGYPHPEENRWVTRKERIQLALAHPGLAPMLTIGSAAHYAEGEFRHASGGFVHGFRHLVPSQLDFALHGEAWDASFASAGEVAEHVLARLSGAASLFHLHGHLADRLECREKEGRCVVYEDVPRERWWRRGNGPDVLVYYLAYHPAFVDPLYDLLADVTRPEGAQQNDGTLSRFLHPVLEDDKGRHHLPEDLRVQFQDPAHHRALLGLLHVRYGWLPAAREVPSNATQDAQDHQSQDQ